jgi:PTS system cellobiose-specific IIC component
MSNGLLVVGLLALDLALYYPFFKIYEKQLLEQEEADTAAANAGTTTDIDDDLEPEAV